MALKLGLRPWDFGRVIWLPGRKLYGFLLTFKPEALYRVGVLEKITDIISEKGVSIIQLKTNFSKFSAEIMVFIDLTEAKVNPEELRKEFNKLELITRVEEIKPLTKGLLVDYIHFPPTVLGEKAVVFRKPICQAFIKEGYSKFGKGHAVFLYYLGQIVGLEGFKFQFGLLKNRTKLLLNLGEAFFKLVGFGVVNVEMINEFSMKAMVRVHHSCECELFKGIGRFSSHFIRGVLAGWFTGYFGREVRVEEVECVARGDSSCLFKITAVY